MAPMLPAPQNYTWDPNNYSGYPARPYGRWRDGPSPDSMKTRAGPAVRGGRFPLHGVVVVRRDAAGGGPRSPS